MGSKELLLLLVVLIIYGCENKIRISGIVVDEVSKKPLENVLVRVVKDINNNKIEFVATKSKNGRFTLEFSSVAGSSNEIPVELSKEGYLTNMYSCFQDRPNDTLF